MKNQSTVLVTGGSGVVGAALLPVLKSKGFKVIALTRRRGICRDDITTVTGDIEREDFGIDVERLLEEHGAISCLIHSAATTNFDVSAEAMHRTNVGGTKNAIALANKLDARLIYISTAFTYEMGLPPYLSEYSSYCETKRTAEKFVRLNARDYTIVRPSIVVGDSGSGEIAYFQGLHNVVAALLQGFAPVLPADPTAMVDMIPQDVLVRAIAALAGRRGRAREYWITRGGSADNVDEIYQNLQKFLNRYKKGASLPKMVDPEIIDRLFKPVFMPSLPRRERKRLNSLIDYSCYFNMKKPFPCNYDELADEFNLEPMPAQNKVLEKNLHYWAERTKFGDKVAFLAEIQQAGIFVIKNFQDNDKAAMIGSYCPSLLFPFAREAISDLVTKGGFPQFLLQPVNFDALYQQHLARVKNQSDTNEGKEPVH